MKKLNILLFAAALVSLTSCLKDGNVNLGPGAPVSPPVIEWSTAQIDDAPKNSNTSLYRLYARIYPIGTSINMGLQVDLTGSGAAPSDITVGLGVSDAAYTAYVAGVTTIPELPAASYTMPPSVTIAKGTRDATVNITLNTTLLDPTKTYYLPVTITSTTYGGISGNYGTVIYSVAPANKYDGLYSYTCSFTNTSNNVVTPLTATNAALITSAANSVTTTFLQNPSYASTAVYTFSTTLNAAGFYPVTGISLPGFFIPSAIDANVSGYYPATKVIRAKYTAGIYTVDETYTYTGSRISTK